MTKIKSSKVARLLMPMILAVIMCFGMSISAFAAGSPATGGTPSDPIELAATKIFQMPQGTTTPAATFNFNFTAVSLDGNTASTGDAAEFAKMPAITSGTISFTSADTGFVTGSTKSIIKQTAGDLLASVAWPHAGEYVYTLEESTTFVTGTGETLTNSSAKYQLNIYVANDGSGGFYVSSIGAVIVTPDPSNSGNVGDKVDPEPGDETDPTDPGDFSSVVFTNVYVFQNDGDPTDPADRALSISKTVEGLLGDTTKYFDFAITATQPSSVTGTAEYKAFIINSATNTIVDPLDNGIAAANIGTDTNGDYVKVVSGTPITIPLKHGQLIAFSNLHTGATYTAVESAYSGYTAEVRIVVNGGTAIDLPATPTENATLSTGARIIGENANSAAFKNTYKTVTPTGILIDNMPYIMLALLLIGALSAYVIAKSRRRSAGAER